MRAGVPVFDLYLCNDLLYCDTHGARVNFPAINVSFLIGPYSKFKPKHAFNWKQDQVFKALTRSWESAERERGHRKDLKDLRLKDEFEAL